MRQVICENCGTRFQTRKHMGRKAEAAVRFCSRNCRDIGMAKENSRPLADRFWAKVDRRGPGDCWQWTGAKTHGGYGVIGIGHAHLLRAPRVSYEMHIGPIPPGMVIRHKCDNPPCVNPAHLEVGTLRDNTHDAVSRGRSRGSARKITDEQFIAIRESAGTVRAAAATFGVSSGFVSMVRNGRRQRHGI